MAYQQDPNQAHQQYYQQQPAAYPPQYGQPQQAHYQPQPQQHIQQYQQPQQVQQYVQQPQAQQLQHHQQQQIQQHQQQQHPQQVQQQVQPHAAHGQVGGQSEWQNSLMDCGPCETCVLGTWLPCFLVGRTSDRMRDPTMQTHETFNSDCMVMCAITYFGCGWFYAMLKRTEIRERYGIRGDATSDCCTTYWCPCCSLIQHDNEVISRTSAAVPIAQGYQPNKEGMVMPQAHPQQQQSPPPQHHQ